MMIKRIKYSVIFIVVFFSWVHFANAGLEITEINNPEVKANHCWIKVYNNSTDEVNLTEWFVMDDDGIISPKPWHYHAINADGSSTLAPNSYAIIADSSASTIDIFKSKNSDITDPLFYGSLTFKDEGTMGLSSDKKTIIGQMSYSGTSISLNNNSSDNSSEDNTVDENIDPAPLIKEDSAILKITTKIISPKQVTAGIPFSLSSLTTTNRGETYAVGRFIWNFGDGKVSEVSKIVPFDYIYNYPGDYVVTLSYYDTVFSNVPDASSRMTIKVVPASITVSSVGNDTDPYIEIENKSSYEIVLSNWIVTAGMHYFVIPEGTTLLANKKIKLSPKITGFVGGDLGYITISNTNKETIATYPVETKKVIYKYSSVNNLTNINQVLSDNAKTDSLPMPIDNSQIINLNNLGASADQSGANLPNPAVYPFIGLAVVIAVGVSAFLLFKRKNNVQDYVEKGIRAEDMTIIE